MHYRITRVQHPPEKRQAMLDLLKSKAEIINSFEGLRYVRMISVSDTEVVAISEYESEEALQAVQGRFREVMSEMMPLMSGAPSVSNGDAIWEQVRVSDD